MSMRKFLRMFLVCFMTMFCGTVMGQEVTLDFTENVWNIPSESKGVEQATFSNGSYSIKLTGTTGNGYKYYPEDKYVILGKQGAMLELPAFSFDVEKIVITGRDGASAQTKQNIYVGDVAVSTETTGAKTANTYVISSDYQAAGNIYVLKVTSAHNTQITKIEIFKKGGGSTVTVTAPTISGTTPFTGSTEVSISGTPEDGKTYYTTDGSDPTSSSTLYSAPFIINETTTVKAISYDKDGNASSVATKIFEKEEIVTANTIAELLALESGKTANLKLNNAVVLFAGKNDIIIKDATGGIDFYQTGLSLTAGQILNGSIIIERSDYNNFKEVKKTVNTNLDNVTITDGTVTPTVSTVANVAASEDCAELYKLENVEVVANGSNWDIVDGETTLRLRDQFKLNYTATAGKFNIIGVIGNYNGTKQFWPTEAPEATQEITIGEVSDINEFKAQPKGKPYKMTLENAQVVYSWTSTNGNVQSYVRDETGALCFFFAKGYEAVSDKFAVNNILNGSIVMQSNNSQTRADAIEQSNENTLTSTTGTAAEPVKIDATKVSEYLNDLVLLENVTIEEKDGKYYVGDVQLYNGMYVESFDTEKKENFSSFVGEGKNVKGIAVVYNTTYEIYPIEITSQGGGETPTTNTIYSWSADSEGNITEIGGKAVANDGESVESVGFSNKGYTTIRVCTKKADVATKNIEITLDKPLEKGDVITVTGYKNKDADGKLVSLYMQFEKGEPIFNDEETWVNICDNEGIDFDNDGNTPKTNTYSVAEDAAGSKTIKLSRSKANTNLFITSFVITRGSSSGIQNVVKPVVENGIRYNLAGQRVDENYKGVVIMNGKKYVVK